MDIEEVKGLVHTTSSSTSSSAKPKPHFVLVHGLGGGAWCWYRIRCLMETCGHKVTCIDLQGSGIHPSDPNSVLSFQQYNSPLHHFFSNLPHHQKVILVGHSAGGLTITDAIHRYSNKIQVVVYVAATMLKHGFSTDQDIKNASPDLSEYGDVCEFEYGLGLDQPPTSVIIKQEFLRKILYHMSPIEDSTLASMLHRPGPVRAIRGVQFPEEKDADSVPRVYIKTMYDRVLKPEQQDAMIKMWPPSQVFVLDSDHSPFFSAPFELFTLFLKVMNSISSSQPNTV